MKKIDTDSLLATVDLAAVLASEMGPGNGAGLWRCPFHKDGSPSMGVVRGKPQFWHCFGCGKNGDAITLLRELRGLSFREACAVLAPGQELPLSPFSAPPAPQRPAVRQSVDPSAAWSARALEVSHAAQDALLSTAGQPAREYLRGRGLADGTIAAFGLGWIADDIYDAPEAWGLASDHRRVWTPAGISIPWWIGRSIWRLNVRRLDPGTGPKYVGPAGWRAGLFNGDRIVPGQPAVLVEGEFDAMAVHQAAEDLATVVATGSTTGGRAARWLYALAACPVVLIAFDADDAGDEAASWWTGLLPNARRLRPEAKDPADMHPERLRTWVASGLRLRAPVWPAVQFPPGWSERFDCGQLERLAIRTVDGGLSDLEALSAEGLTVGEDPGGAGVRSGAADRIASRVSVVDPLRLRAVLRAPIPPGADPDAGNPAELAGPG